MLLYVPISQLVSHILNGSSKKMKYNDYYVQITFVLKYNTVKYKEIVDSFMKY